MNKKIIFSGIQPSGELNIGAYIGAIKNWVQLQDEYFNYFCMVDLHAITTRQDPADLRKRSLEQAALYIACGIDPAKCVLFIQSHVPAHAELAWVLSCYTMYGELSRMTQFKDKSAKNADNVNGGLLMYPTLMAADILLYKTNLVPVGIDQKQHLELARNIAVRFNGIYGDTFIVPDGYIPKLGSKIYSLTDVTSKMSKSDGPGDNGVVLLLDSRDVIMKKFKRAVTDSDMSVRFAEGKDGINNLMAIYSAFTGKSFDEIEAEFDGKGYGVFKPAVGEAVADGLEPVQKRFAEIMADRSGLERILRDGADKAAAAAAVTLREVYEKIGFCAAAPRD